MVYNPSLASRATFAASRQNALRRSTPSLVRSYAIPPTPPHSPMTSPPPTAASATSPVSAPNTPMAKRVVPVVPPIGQQPIIVSTTIPNPTTTAPPLPSSRGVPVTPPPSNGGRPKRGPVKRFVYWVGALSFVFYSTATYAALHNDTFEDVYVQYVPAGASLVEWAEDKELDRVGVEQILGGVSEAGNKATSIYNRLTGTIPSAHKAAQHTSDKTAELQRSIEARAAELKSKAASSNSLVDSASELATDAKTKAANLAHLTHSKLDSASSKVEKNAKKPEESQTTAGEDARAKLFAPVDDSKLIFVDGRTEVEKRAEEIKEKAEKVARDGKDKVQAEASRLASQGQAKGGEVVDRLEKGAKDLKAEAERELAAARRTGSDLSHVVADKGGEVVDRLEKGAKDLKAEAERELAALRRTGSDVSHALGDKAAEFQKSANELGHAVEEKGSDLKDEVLKTLDYARTAAASTASSVQSTTSDVLASTQASAHDLKVRAEQATHDASSSLSSLTSSAVHSSEQAAHDLKLAASNAVSSTEKKLESAGSTAKKQAFEWSEGVEDLAARAEHALGSAVDKAESKVASAEKAVKQRIDKDVMHDDLLPWTTPLPIGHEPPPGYYVPKKAAPPPKPKSTKGPGSPPTAGSPSASPTGAAPSERLPLLAPTVKSFSTSEPILSQLASTIDSLTSYLSSSPSNATSLSSPAPKDLVASAQKDLSALSDRLAAVREEERSALEGKIAERAKEFEGELRKREQELGGELERREEGWKNLVEDERERLVGAFRQRLENELEVQREIIDQRLKEEVITQGVELQKKWLADVKTQVENERGGRLSKLGELESGLKNLEKVTLKNSELLDDNLRVQSVWSALRALQTAIDQPRQPFSSQLAALQSLTTTSPTSHSPATTSAIPIALASIPSSAASEGVETLPTLTYWFTSRVAPRIRSVALVPETADVGLLSHVASAALSWALLLRPKGDVEGDDVGSVLSRAEERLARRDLDGAAREVNGLKGWAGVLAQDWLREARKRLEVEQALAVVSTEATLESLLVV